MALEDDCDHTTGIQHDITRTGDEELGAKRYLCGKCGHEYTVPRQDTANEDPGGQSLK
ncbi:hypothetical protein ACWGH4_23390 [Streptomyces sp. NPDC054847]|jgi:hypothetical protein|uniref:hypothetical protein n=1 Tax=Streptomyces sp. OZ13 TaxID=3452210 RepID=UPI003F8CD35A